MLQQEFEDTVRAITSFNMCDFETAGVIQQGDTGAWVDFTRNPFRWVTHLAPPRAEKMWALIDAHRPVRNTEAESADALHDISQLATEFGWGGDSSLWRWLKARLESYARHNQRVGELLENNNEQLQQARTARAEAKSWKHDFEMYANAWARELGSLCRKSHLIDALVKTTRHVVERAAVADHLERVAAAKRKGIYMASKLRHAVTWKMLRSAGLPIISTWIDEAGDGETSDFADLWRRCVAEAVTAEVVIVYRLPGETLKGAWAEVGAALAYGVPVYAVGIPPKGSTGNPDEEFTIGAAAGITHFATLDAAVEAARVVMAEAA